MLLSVVAATSPARASMFAAIGDTVAPRPAFQVDSTHIAPPPGVVTRPDTVLGVPQKADTTGERKLGLFDQPRFVMARSLLFPGWGQAHNRAWIKAVVIAGVEWYLIASVVQDERALKDLNAQIEAAQAAGDFDTANALVDQYNAKLNSSVSHQWWLGGVVVYSMADAYVDAHFVNFKFEFEHDRALRGHTAGARISVEKKF